MSLLEDEQFKNAMAEKSGDRMQFIVKVNMKDKNPSVVEKMLRSYISEGDHIDILSTGSENYFFLLYIKGEDAVQIEKKSGLSFTWDAPLLRLC